MQILCKTCEVCKLCARPQASAESVQNLCNRAEPPQGRGGCRLSGGGWQQRMGLAAETFMTKGADLASARAGLRFHDEVGGTALHFRREPPFVNRNRAPCSAPVTPPRKNRRRKKAWLPSQGRVSALAGGLPLSIAFQLGALRPRRRPAGSYRMATRVFIAFRRSGRSTQLNVLFQASTLG